MKNFLWFLHKPNDEREQLLYIKAYKQVLSFLLGIFVVASIFTGILGIGDGVFSVPFWALDMFIDIVFLVCIFIGWNILRKEELDSLSRPVTHPIKVRTIFAVLIVVFAGVVVLSQFFLEWSLLFYFVGFLIFWGALAYFSWKSMSGAIPLLIRVYLALLYPIFVLVFSRLSSKITVRKFISRSFLSFVFHIVLLLVFALVFTLTSGPRYSVMTDRFEPDLQKGQQVFASDFTELKVNDYIVFLGNSDQQSSGVSPYIGRVVSVGASLQVDTSQGPVSIEQRDILGLVVKPKMSNLFSFFSTVTDIDSSTNSEN